MGKYYLYLRYDGSAVYKLLEKNILPGIYSDGYDYYVAIDISTQENKRIKIDCESNIHEFSSDEAALLWYKLNY